MHNVTGFMVGKKTEREGLVKSGSLFVDAVSRSVVPHLSVICGASYGAGNYAVPSHPQSVHQCELGRCADGLMSRDSYSVGLYPDALSWGPTS